MSEQPKALRLAALLEIDHRNKAAAELRRQHERIAELEADVARQRESIAASWARQRELEAALLARGEPVALHALLNQVIYGDFSGDIPEHLTLALNAKKELLSLAHPAPEVNTALLEALTRMEFAFAPLAKDCTLANLIDEARAAIAAAEKEVRRD